MFLEQLIARSGEYEAYKMFSQDHFIIAFICFSCIAVALYMSRNMKEKTVLKTVRIATIGLWTLEILKIAFNFYIGNARYPHTYVPLYFCSLILYAGILSSYSKGVLKRIGDVFIVVGGIVGGVAYIFTPCTTAGIYPAFHFITIQSFIHHSMMIYLGTLFVASNYLVLQKKDWVYYTSTIVCASIVAYIVNIILDSNLMFVTKTNPGTITDVVYNMSPRLYPLAITFWQAIPPFVVVYYI